MNSSIYDAVGGERFFLDLVDRFYEGVENDPVLRPLYPETELSGARRRLALFLIQYFGGPGTYSQERGHPRLRMRHMPFAIGESERAAWMRHMRASMEAAGAEPAVAQQMLAYFENTAAFMVNQPH